MSFEQLEDRRLLSSYPVISEFVALNRDGLRDSFNEASDWIELHNPTDAPINLTGWYLTDNASNLTKWALPDVNLAAGGYLVVFASDRNLTDPAGQLHTNFKLSGDGEYLALVMPDGTIAHEYTPGFPSQWTDVSYGLVQEATVLVGSGATAKYLVPNVSQAGLNWTAVAFNDSSWQSGPTGLGYDSGNGFTVNYYKVNTAVAGTVNNITQAEAIIADPNKYSTKVTVYAPTINYYGSGGNYGRYTGDLPFPTQTLNQAVDDFIIEAFATVYIPSAGQWTFGVNSDDGFRLVLNNSSNTYSMEFANPRGPSDTLQTFNFSQAGLYSLRLVYFERGGGAEVELFASPGSYTSWNATTFDLVGDTANGGLSVSGFAGAVQTNVSSPMQGVNSSLWMRIPFTVTTLDDLDTLALRLKYNDGFVAYLNGVEVARANAPAALSYNSSALAMRDPTLGMAFSEFNLTSVRHLLQVGGNVLAIHALNNSASDGTFLVLPELLGVKTTTEARFFTEPTPGAANLTAHTDFVADTKFSHDRGFYDQPFELVITTNTPGAEIRYTLDGTAPTETRGFVYTGPIAISGTTTVRAMAHRPGWQSTNIDTHTYIFPSDVLVQSPDGQPPVPPDGVSFAAKFDTGLDGFVYADDLFGTSNPNAAQGMYTATEGQSGGGLKVVLGPGPTGAASGGFSKTITVEQAGLYGVWLRYRLVMGPDFATDEYGELVCTIDGVRYGGGTGASLVRITGDGPGGSNQNSGWQIYKFNVNLSAGTHTLRLGAYFNDADTSSGKWLNGFFDEVIFSQWPAATVNSQVIDYGMDPDIVNNPVWGPQLISALTAIPTISLVLPLGNLFDPATGIYCNAAQAGAAWERLVSVELINPDGTAGFQVEAGLRIRGGYSTSGDNPKHAFRLFFRDEYGDSKLVYALFGDEGVDTFDKIDLRCSQNYSWSFAGSNQNAVVRDVFARDTQADMGDPYTRSRPYHLYINGQYWGLYETQERADANFAESYLGGDDDDYDVIKVADQPPFPDYTIFATDGNMNAWQDFWNQAAGKFTVYTYMANVPVTSLAAANGVIADTSKQLSAVAGSADVINYLNTGSDGRFTSGNAAFPNTTIGANVDNFVICVTGTIEIPAVGPWTFGVNADDGFHLELSNGSQTFVMSKPGPNASPVDTLATFNITQAGSYNLRLVYFDNTGGASLELFAAQGEYATFDSSAFKLVGDTAAGGLARSTMASDTAYMRVQGLNPDGTPNPFFPKLLDARNLIDYMMVIFFTGNTDAPISNFLGNQSPNNWYGIYNRVNPDGFKFFAHDSEHTLTAGGAAVDRTGPYPAGDVFNKSNPQWIHQQLMYNAEYRLAFADRAHALLANGGLLTAGPALARYQERCDEIALAVIAESARWGDAKVATPYTKNHWISTTDADKAYLQTRAATILAQLKVTKLRDNTVAPLYPPSISPAVFSQHGGQVAYGYGLSMAGSGVIYYTLDGSDPRLPGGAVSPTALVFNPNATNVTLVAANSVWKYLDNGSNPGTAWYAPAFNDASWNSGPGVLGRSSDNAGISTLIEIGPSGNRYVTTYFRREFEVDDPEEFTSLLLEVMRDDGVVVYLNGVEVARSNMPAGAINYQTFASSTVGDETTYHPIDLTAYRHLLIDGQNVLAVELHQINRTTSDARFDLKLTAVRAADVIPLYSSGAVRTRSLSGGTWSALNEAMFYVGTPAAAGNLAITELNYNPYAPTAAEQGAGFTDAQQFEYVELRNIGPTMIDLTGVRFTEGISFDFTGSAMTVLAPGEYVLVVRDAAAFALRYGEGLPVAGTYSGALDNSGERVTLTDRFEEPIVSLRYRRDQGWPWRPNGIGSTLEIIDPAAAADSAANWRASSEYGGTPGAAGAGPLVSLVINEVLTHTDLPQVDSIELYNPTSAAIDVAGWWLSDSRGNLWKYQFPGDTPSWTTIGPGGYLVIDESHFNPDPLNPPAWAFSLSALGDEVWLVSADSSGRPLAFVDFVEFGAAVNGESFGRWPDGSGVLYPMRSVTLGSANSGPRVGPVVISELLYAPTASTAEELALAPTMTTNDFEFIELYNPTHSAVDLSGWQFRQGVTYEFAAGTTIAAGGTLVILPFDPRLDGAKWSAFSLRYFGSAAVAVPANFVGGWTGVLDNSGETVGLYWPDDPPAENPSIIPWILMDRLSYLPGAPWPTASGVSLSRLDPGGWGEDPGSWTAATGTPGSVGYYAALVSAEAFSGGSRWDGALPPAAPVEVLWPGGEATAENYGNYSGGLNGLRLRFEGLPEGAALSAESFQFRWGNSGAVESWAAGPALQSVTMQPGGWAVLRFGSDAVRNGWLEVRVLADASTRLATDVVFYVGNLVGDVNGDFAVTAADAAAIQAAASPLQAVAGSASVFDINGDGVVNATDVLLARRNVGTVLTELSAPLPAGPLWAGGAIPLADAMPLNDAMLPADATPLGEAILPTDSGPLYLSSALLASGPQVQSSLPAEAVLVVDSRSAADRPTDTLGWGAAAASVERGTGIAPVDGRPAFAAAWTEAVWTFPVWTMKADSVFAPTGAASTLFDSSQLSGRIARERSTALSADTDWLAELRTPASMPWLNRSGHSLAGASAAAMWGRSPIGTEEGLRIRSPGPRRGAESGAALGEMSSGRFAKELAASSRSSKAAREFGASSGGRVDQWGELIDVLASGRGRPRGQTD